MMTETAGDNQKDIVKEAVRQFVDASLRGEKPDLDEFARQYPGLESQIRRGIQELHKINNLFDSLVKADDSDFENITDEYDLVGKKVGSFEIVKIIGRGGMGVVYLAHDTRLKRSVAVKSIPAALTGNSTARMRFRREAELLASLNHPNIAVIHEIIEEEKSGYLILEHVEGETLAERIAREPLKLEEALSIGRQVAEAISAAHKKGVIHRDLKPGNIKITPDGQVKVLDFGLAKATVTEGGSGEVTETQPGHIIGTPAYMSPEQARGRPIDKRSDIWSFGCVLYEMLTGMVLFKGETASDTLANILQAEPDFQPLPASTPANIRVLLRRCLEKDPSHRLHDIADARIEISETQSGTLEAFALPGETAAAPQLFRRNVILVALVCLIAGVLITVAILMNLGRLVPHGASAVSRFSVPIPTDKPLWLKAAPQSCLTVSPDGTRFVYVGSGSDKGRQLYLRSIGELKIEPIPGTEGAVNPFFSPDGRWVGFFAGDLKKVSLAGGEPVTLIENMPRGGPVFGSWAEDGTIVFKNKRGLNRISDNGGKPEILILPEPEENQTSFDFPQALPGGNAILYTRRIFKTYPHISHIEVFLPETRQQLRVLDNASWAKYVRSGHLIFMQNNVLMAAPFDAGQLKITGPAVPLIDDVYLDWANIVPQIAVSRNGTIVYVLGPKIYKMEPVWVDRQGQSESLAIPAQRYISARLSPDELQIALTVNSQKGFTPQVQIYDIVRGTLFPLTTDGENWLPEWSPDGKQIAFWSKRTEGSGVFCKFVNGSDTLEQLNSKPSPGGVLLPYSWSGDGKLIACTVQNPGGDIWILPLDGDRIPQPLIETKHKEFNPTFSPDGRWLAYVSNESGSAEVYLIRYPDNGLRIPVSSGGGAGPIWSRDGQELYYVNGQIMMAVQIGSEPDSSLGTPEQLFVFDGRYSTAGNLGRTYDISKSGRFLMLKRSEDIELQLICVQNWFEELKRMVPTDEER